MKLTTIIVFLAPVVMATHIHRTVLESILRSKRNLYAKVNSEVQNVINNLFEALNLPPSFLAKSRTKAMLSMHYNLNIMTEKNYDAYANMIAAARPDTGNKSTNRISLYELIKKTLDDEPFNIFGKLYENISSRDHTIYNNKIAQHATIISTDTSLKNVSETDDPVFANSKEFINFTKDFIKKVDDLSETDFSKSTTLVTPIGENSTKPDLETWEPQPFDINNSSTRKLYMGKRTSIKKFPFVVSIHVMQAFVCSGSILSSDVVITAASCLQLLHNNRFFRENPKVVYVRTGSDFYRYQGEYISALEFYFYPSYNPRNLNNNLVLIRLRRHINFYTERKVVKKIRYDTSPAHLPYNVDGVVVAGWGANEPSNIIDAFQRMLTLKLDVYPQQECAEVYNDQRQQYVTERHFCAGYMSIGAGACNKDLGSPGVVDNTLMGVVSFGSPSCGSLDTPTVFTKVGFYAKWIDSVLRMESRSVYARTTPRRVTTPAHFFIKLATKITQRIKPLITPALEINVLRDKDSLNEEVEEEDDTRRGRLEMDQTILDKTTVPVKTSNVGTFQTKQSQIASLSTPVLIL